MKKLTLLAVMAAVSLSAAAQPLYRFSVKVGIDCESVDSLGGPEAVKKNIAMMFDRVNRAFNHSRQFKAVYDFQVDWDAFYIYDGISLEEVFKPHPDHDYLVVIDGYKSDPAENGGGWYGADIQTVYHARTHNDRFNDPFNTQAVDGIIHEFGHARGVPDIYAMKVDADKNQVAPVACYGTRCIMDYPYGETFWSSYAVNMINLAGDRRVEIDSLVRKMLPEVVVISVTAPGGSPAEKAKVEFYPVGWYSYSVENCPELSVSADRNGRCSVPAEKIFPESEGYGLKYPNVFVKAEYDGMTAYGWLPLYEVENAVFAGKDEFVLELRLDDGIPDNPFGGK